MLFFSCVLLSSKLCLTTLQQLSRREAIPEWNAIDGIMGWNALPATGIMMEHGSTHDGRTGIDMFCAGGERRSFYGWTIGSGLLLTLSLSYGQDSADTILSLFLITVASLPSNSSLNDGWKDFYR